MIIATMLIAAAVPERVRSDARCPANAARSLVGRRADADARRQARRIAGRGRVRWIMPGGLVTQDYSEGRLNVQVGANDRIERVWCG